MPKPISAAEAPSIRVVVVTLDDHLAGAALRCERALQRSIPGLSLAFHSAAMWGEDATALEEAKADIAAGDIILVTMMFMDEHARAIRPALEARRMSCDALVAVMSIPEIAKLTRMGKLVMGGPESGMMAMLKKLRGKSSSGAPSAGAKQMAMLRRLPRLLRFIPGTAQDLRIYFLTLQYWLAGSEENLSALISCLVDRYADGPRKVYRGTLKIADPIDYPDVGIYHPRMKGRIGDDPDQIPARAIGAVREKRGRVGVLVLRSYPLAGNTAHYDGVIASLEARGLEVVPAFASGLDARPAIDRYFTKNGKATIDALVSLTGFSLVGGPAYNDARAAEAVLSGLDVPYMAAHPVEFQTIDQWASSDRGLLPVEQTIMVAIPELDGASGPIVFGGRAGAPGVPCRGCDKACVCETANKARDMMACTERADLLARRVERLVGLRRKTHAERHVAIVLFNFPPNAGNTGTAAYLGVFESLLNTMKALKAEGYAVDLPANVDELRSGLVVGNAAQHGAHANVAVKIAADDHVRRERWLKQIEGQWGSAPGKQQSDGRSIFVLGRHFGNVFVGIQPAFGYEGDPMRLLFEKGFAPTHAFSAFYRYLKEDFHADVVLHFGTHGALEFMPGKQAGLSEADWPDRLIGDLPNVYLYASNNPSEGTIAKRRSAATLVSYMTPPIASAGLYRGLLDLKATIERYRGTVPEADAERRAIAPVLQAQAAAVDLSPAEPAWAEETIDSEVRRIAAAVLELEYTLIPHGLHVVGEASTPAERIDFLQAIAEASHAARPARSAIEALVAGAGPDVAVKMAGPDAGPDPLAMFRALAETDRLLAQDHEIKGLMRALDGRFIAPAPGGDVLRTPAVLPTGRNLHGFDPFRIPSAFAIVDGAKQATKLLTRHLADGNPLPETVALVLWGTDNLKSEGGPIGQALALLGAEPRFDGYGRLAGATLLPLESLGRPRIDVVLTLSGIFRDLMPLQTKMLAEACFLAASADESPEMNYVRKHALAHMAKTGCDIETAGLRVFSNADGAYGANVNLLVDNGRWDDEDELAETYQRRKSFAYGRNGKALRQPELLEGMLATVDLAYQNLESVELGVTTIDQYFDTLGGISRAARRARGGVSIPVYIGDQTRGEGQVRTLGEQIALETRTRMLNPKWYEGLLKHGYEGVRQIEVAVTNTMGWSATTGDVAPWVYQQITRTFMLDEDMRKRLAELNPTAAAKVANRLIEAHERKYWTPDPEMLETLRRAGEELEDRLEGVSNGTVAA